MVRKGSDVAVIKSREPKNAAASKTTAITIQRGLMEFFPRRAIRQHLHEGSHGSKREITPLPFLSHLNAADLETLTLEKRPHPLRLVALKLDFSSMHCPAAAQALACRAGEILNLRW